MAAFEANCRRQLLGLLRCKNAVEYEQRGVTEAEAVGMLDQAQRFAAWARRQLPAT